MPSIVTLAPLGVVRTTSLPASFWRDVAALVCSLRAAWRTGGGVVVAPPRAPVEDDEDVGGAAADGVVVEVAAAPEAPEAGSPGVDDEGADVEGADVEGSADGSVARADSRVLLV